MSRQQCGRAPPCLSWRSDVCLTVRVPACLPHVCSSCSSSPPCPACHKCTRGSTCGDHVWISGVCAYGRQRRTRRRLRSGSLHGGLSRSRCNPLLAESQRGSQPHWQPWIEWQRALSWPNQPLHFGGPGVLPAESANERASSFEQLFPSERRHSGLIACRFHGRSLSCWR